jgi:hypothetical protein
MTLQHAAWVRSLTLSLPRWIGKPPLESISEDTKAQIVSEMRKWK